MRSLLSLASLGAVLAFAACSTVLKYDDVSFGDAEGGVGGTESAGGSGGTDTDGCTPKGCAELGAQCGQLEDGCGTEIDCGTCGGGVTCAGNKCSCTPTDCAAAGYECDSLDDGCGKTLTCGPCSGSDVCGGGGVPHKCAPPTGHHETRTDPGGTGSEPGGVIPVCCVPSTEEKNEITQVFDLLNQHRQANGCGALAYDDKLESAIEGHCHHMAAHDFFDHPAPESVVGDPWTRASLCGTNASGENIAAGQQSASEVMTSWKNSSGHNANMLNCSFTRVGIGYFAGGSWGAYWGQLFD